MLYIVTFYTESGARHSQVSYRGSRGWTEALADIKAWRAAAPGNYHSTEDFE